MDNEIDYDAITWPAQLTKAVHRDMYPPLNPSQPSLSAEGKIVLVTGVTGGIGRAIAEAWTIARAKAVVITGRKVEALNETAATLQERGSGKTKIIAVPADITKEEDVRRLWETAKSEAGRVDVLVNNAGSLTQAAIGELDPSRWFHDFVSIHLASHGLCRAKEFQGSQCQRRLSERTLLPKAGAKWRRYGHLSELGHDG